MTRLATILLLAAGCLIPATAAEPVRAVVLTRNAGLVLEAHTEFQRRYGNDLLELTVSADATCDEAIANADVVFSYYLGTDVYERATASIRTASERGASILPEPRANSDRFWEVSIDESARAQAATYWEYGGIENLVSFLTFLYRLGGGERTIRVSRPEELPTTGIYHPDAEKPFASLEEYLGWYRTRGLVPPDAPLAGILTYSTQYKLHDLGHIDGLVRELESRGIGAVPIFGWPLPSLRNLLEIDGERPLRLLFAFSLGFTNDEDIDVLRDYGVHVINLLTSRSSETEWRASTQGVQPTRMAMTFDSPERAGATEPILVATSEPITGTDGTRTTPIAERIRRAVDRAERWLALQDKANADKRVVMLYYNNPPGKGNIGASYLNLFPSVVAMLGRMKEAGFETGREIPSEPELIDMVQRSGRNIEMWAPGEIDTLVSEGHVVLISMEKYRHWFSELPEEFREFVNAGWGPPEDSRLMVITSRDGEKCFIVPGIRFGNIFLGPQPLRTAFEKDEEKMLQSVHDMVTPPPHSYVAAYLWYRHEFRADAVVHIGRHGTLEFLPGKAVALSGSDPAEVILGDLPNINYYIIDGGGEAIQARRRSAAALIGHLTPLSAAGGPQERFEPLRSALDNLEQTAGVSPALEDQYREQAIEEIRRLNLDRQLGLDVSTADWEEVEHRVHNFLEAIESGPIPLGMHTIGALPNDAVQRDALRMFLSRSFTTEEQPRVEASLDGWAEALFADTEPAVDPAWPADLRDKALTVLSNGAQWLGNLRASRELELDSLVALLEGRYLESGDLGDPLRTPASLPSGRNLHAFDTSKMPTRAAWEIGKKMADEMLAKFRGEHGRYPEKVAMVLWYGETSRHHGAMESQALYLMGARPVWNARDKIDTVELIPDEELGRPRVDVVLTISGIYRDGLSDKVLLLTKAAQLAAAAGENALSRHNRETTAALVEAGIDPELAAKVAQARAFSSAPGDYGAGISKMVEQSRNADNNDGIASLYLQHMNHAYSDELWGQAVEGALAQQLEGNEAVIHSRTTNVYGVLDNDDFFDYAGGLNLATRTVNGEAPEFYVDNMRVRGAESVEGFRQYLATELNARVWNPKWISQMQNSGYAGARQIARHVDHLYGFQATAPEQMDGSYWQQTYDTLVADENGLGLDEFFEHANPHALQRMEARLLEVDRQGVYKFSPEDRAALIESYVLSVNRHGVDCSANTCGNLRVHEYIAAQAGLVSGLGDQELRAFGERLGQATQWAAQTFSAASPAFRQGLTSPRPRRTRTVAAPPPDVPAPTRRPSVEGFKMEEQTIRLAQTGWSSEPLLSTVCLGFLIALLLLGALRQAALGEDA